MKKILSLLVVASLLIFSTSCTKENLKKVKKDLTNTNAKSQGSSGTSTPPAAAADHQSGCPNHHPAG